MNFFIIWKQIPAGGERKICRKKITMEKQYHLEHLQIFCYETYKIEWIGVIEGISSSFSLAIMKMKENTALLNEILSRNKKTSWAF